MSGAWTVVPCFDEHDRLDRDEMRRLATLVDGLLLVDDGSTDATGEMIDGLATDEPRIEALHLSPNRGKAEAVRRGLLEAIARGADAVGYLDADLATPVDAFVALRERLGADDAPDAVIGSRVQLLGHDIVRRPARHYLGRLYATAASMALGVGVYDTQCGAKLFRVDDRLRRCLSEPFGDRWAFDVELLARLLDAPAARIVEVPLSAWHEVPGSRLGTGASVRAAASLVGVARRRHGRRSAGS